MHSSPRPIGVKIGLANAYKHLGGWISADGSPAREASQRRHIMDHTLGVLRRTIFKQRALKDEHSLIFADALAWPQLSYLAALWPERPKQQWHTHAAAYVGIYRSALKCRRNGDQSHNISDEAVLLRADRLSLADRATLIRLRYLSRALRFAPPSLHGALNEAFALKTPWIRQLLADIVKAASLLDKQAPAPADHIASWCDLAREHPQQWCSLIRCLAAEMCFRAHTVFRLEIFKHALCRDAACAGTAPPTIAEAPPAPTA